MVSALDGRWRELPSHVGSQLEQKTVHLLQAKGMGTLMASIGGLCCHLTEEPLKI